MKYILFTVLKKDYLKTIILCVLSIFFSFFIMGNLLFGLAFFISLLILGWQLIVGLIKTSKSTLTVLTKVGLWGVTLGIVILVQKNLDNRHRIVANHSLEIIQNYKIMHGVYPSTDEFKVLESTLKKRAFYFHYSYPFDKENNLPLVLYKSPLTVFDDYRYNFVTSSWGP